MAYKKILIGYDGSEPCERAAAQALDLAKEQGAQVVGLKVISFSYETIVPSDHLWEAIVEDIKAKARTMLGGLEALAKERGVDIALEIREGDVGEEIAATAKEVGADLVVLAVGSRSSRMGRFLGQGQRRVSLRELTIAVAPCAVLLVG